MRLPVKSGRQAESHGSTTITVGVKVLTNTLVIPARSESSPALPESPDNLSIFKGIPRLPNRAVTPVEEEILGLAGLILINPDPLDHCRAVPPSTSAPERFLRINMVVLMINYAK